MDCLSVAFKKLCGIPLDTDEAYVWNQIRSAYKEKTGLNYEDPSRDYLIITGMKSDYQVDYPTIIPLELAKNFPDDEKNQYKPMFIAL